MAQATPDIFARYDRVRIINLTRRTDRRREMQAQLDRVGMGDDPRVAFFPAIAPTEPGRFGSNGAHGAFQSHTTILKEAAAANESVLILEDDCGFLPEIWTYRQPADCDVFYGGYYPSDPDNLEQSGIVGGHFMGFSSRAVQVARQYFQDYLRDDFVGDAKAILEPGYDPEVRPPIDGGYVWMRWAHPELVTHFAMLGTQVPFSTDIGQQHAFEKMPVLRTLLGLVRRVRRRLGAKV